MSGDIRELHDPYRCRIRWHCDAVDHDCQILRNRLISLDQVPERADDPIPLEKMPYQGIPMNFDLMNSSGCECHPGQQNITNLKRCCTPSTFK